MAPGVLHGDIKIKVPRHNAQRLGSKLTAEVKATAVEQKVQVDLFQSNQEAINQAVVCANQKCHEGVPPNSTDRRALPNGTLCY